MATTTVETKTTIPIDITSFQSVRDHPAAVGVVLAQLELLISAQLPIAQSDRELLYGLRGQLAEKVRTYTPKMRRVFDVAYYNIALQYPLRYTG